MAPGFVSIGAPTPKSVQSQRVCDWDGFVNRSETLLSRRIKCRGGGAVPAVVGMSVASGEAASERRSGFVCTEGDGHDSNRGDVKVVDVFVIGGGPAGLALAAALGKHVCGSSAKVMVMDATLNKRWPANYGVWMHELEASGYGDCASITWPKTAVFMRGDDHKQSFQIPYARVDRDKLKAKLLHECATNGIEVVAGVVNSVDESDSTFTALSIQYVESNSNAEPQKSVVNARLVIDATGHALKFIQFQNEHEPGFQAAYGIECEAPNHGFPLDEMVLMDYRDAHMRANAVDREAAQNVPLFLYAMPIDNDRIFLEETSLIATPPVSFEFLKEQLYRRLDFMGVNVSSVSEEEFCLIPMGGAMPRLDQRVVAFGGAAGFVHPATGYSLTRTLKQASVTAAAIAQELSVESSSSPSSSSPASQMSERLWAQIWSPERQRQRDFLLFGGDLLQKVTLNPLREFFAAFFDLPVELWSDFLAFGLMDPAERLEYGVRMFFLTSNRVRLLLIQEALLNGGAPFWLSVVPLGFNSVPHAQRPKSSGFRPKARRAN